MLKLKKLIRHAIEITKVAIKILEKTQELLASIQLFLDSSFSRAREYVQAARAAA